MSTIRDTALQFIHDVEAGKGWAVCRQYCHPDATFSSQVEHFGGIDTIEGYAESMKWQFAPFPDYGGDVRSCGVDDQRRHVIVYGRSWGTHTGEGGPVAPTGRRFEVDGVAVMSFDGDLIRHLTLVMDGTTVAQQLGWT
jgi:predicted ester cyclase